MILKLFINIILFIIQAIIKIILAIVPDIGQEGMWAEITTLLRAILGISTQAKNFCYFILGDTFFMIIEILTIYLTFKLVIYPIALLIRRNLTKTE